MKDAPLTFCDFADTFLLQKSNTFLSYGCPKCFRKLKALYRSLDRQQLTVLRECAVGLVREHLLREDLAELYTLLVKAV